MNFCENEFVSAHDIANLRESVGWNRMESCYEDPLMVSFYHIAVYDNELLVGYVDCASNGVTDAYIQDLVVHPDYQNRGIGTELMNRMISYLKTKGIYMISVIYDDSLSPFYNRFGFAEMRCGQMEMFDCR